MNRTLRIAVPLAICGWLAAGVASAGPPDPANSECPGPAIYVVGHDGVVGDPAGEYCVTIRDFNNVPVVNALVTIDFSNCGDVQLCTNQLDPGVSIDCIARTLSRRTDALGRACFRAIGKRRDVDCVATPSPCVEVWWDNSTFVCALFAPVFDLVNEGGGVGLSGNDLSEFLHVFFDCGVYLSAIDYNANGSIDGDDFSRWLNAFFGHGSALNCPPAEKCP